MTIPKTRRALFLPLLLLCACVPLATARKGGTGPDRAFAAAPASGFLADYGRLELHPDDEFTRLWRSRDAVLAGYDQFILDEVELHLVSEAPLRKATQKELEHLAGQLQTAFAEQLHAGKGYRVVKSPGARTLRIRLALTDVEPVGKGRRAATTATGTAVGVVIPGAGFLIPRFDVGWAAIEMDLIDTDTGERVACAMSSRVGGRMGGGVFRRYKRWGDARRAFDSWAKQFRRSLDDAHRAR